MTSASTIRPIEQNSFALGDDDEISSLSEMDWARPGFSKSRIDSAGRALIKPSVSDQEINEALEAINNWRSSHSYPLNTFQMGLRRALRSERGPWLVAQRIKRLPAIKLKLSLNRNMALSQMQDIGGCRAVVGTVAEVRALVDHQKKSRSKQELIKPTDYIDKPRDSGYRSVHLIYRYHSDNKSNEPYNGLRIEMQLRSRLQHAWATAVETTGDFIGQALKSNLGSDDWLRFFRLMAGAIAIEERTNPVPNIPTNETELKRELRAAAKSLNVVGTLQTFGHIAQTRTNIAGADLFLIATDPLGKSVRVTGFRKDQSEAAMQQYAANEKAAASIPGVQVVLVSVDSIRKLRRAYPSYFLESRVFLNALRRATAR
jgi:Region found in RelA / SpoT proteins